MRQDLLRQVLLQSVTPIKVFGYIPNHLVPMTPHPEMLEHSWNYLVILLRCTRFTRLRFLVSIGVTNLTSTRGP